MKHHSVLYSLRSGNRNTTDKDFLRDVFFLCGLHLSTTIHIQSNFMRLTKIAVRNLGCEETK